MIAIIDDNHFAIEREYEFKTVDYDNPAYDANNPRTWSVLEKKEILKSVIEINTVNFKVLYEHKPPDATSPSYYALWIANSEAVYYIRPSHKNNYSLPANKENEIWYIKKITIKPQHFHEITVIDKHFIKTKKDVFYEGKRIAKANAASFKKVNITKGLYEDDNKVYSFSRTTGLDSIEILPAERYYLPKCWYFADNVQVYHHSAWSNAIELEDEDKIGETSHFYDVLEACVYKDKNNPTEAEEEKYKSIRDTVNIWNDVFDYFHPERVVKRKQLLSTQI